MKVIDNALGGSLFNLIKDKIFNELDNFPWFFIENSAYAFDEKLIEESPLGYSFYHLAMDDGRIESSYFDISNAVALTLKDRFLIGDNWDVYRLRWGMTTSINKAYKDYPHIDNDDNHKVILFYLNDTDGDTYFYDKDHNIIDSVSPKENRAVLFDGSVLHSSSKPTKSVRRIVLNINLIKVR